VSLWVITGHSERSASTSSPSAIESRAPTDHRPAANRQQGLVARPRWGGLVTSEVWTCDGVDNYVLINRSSTSMSTGVLTCLWWRLSAGLIQSPAGRCPQLTAMVAARWLAGPLRSCVSCLSAEAPSVSMSCQ
jgi:hypothetical protein